MAETNKGPQGRWVLMPRKGEQFLGSRSRNRARVCRRRRQVLTVLAEVTALTVIIGLFPPLRAMFAITAVLAVVLLLYVASLAKMRADRDARIRAARTGPLAVGPAVSVPESNGNGTEPQLITERDYLRESGVRIVGDGVHVTVRRAEESASEARGAKSKKLASVAG